MTKSIFSNTFPFVSRGARVIDTFCEPENTPMISYEIAEVFGFSDRAVYVRSTTGEPHVIFTGHPKHYVILQ